MNFLKELSLKDKVIIHESISESETVFSITKDDKTSFALQLNWK
jgi:medium-chain acyl-[acyl-carrier-protein] hydrolase